LAARELPVIGRSVEARRQIIRRAKKIAQISPEAKKAAIKARLQNNQQALLKIAKAGGQKAQLRMVAELAEISKELRAPRNRAAKRSRAEGDTSTAATVRSSLQAGANEIAADADDAPAEATGNHRPAHKTATLEEMVSLWEPECRARWAYLPSEDRERFIEIIRRARRRARVDVVEFLKDVFRGRQKVSKQDLFGIAAMHGFATNTIRKALKGLGYRTKRKGHGRGAKWFVINPDRRWEKYLPVISDAELKAAVEAQPDPRDTAAADDGWDSRAAADYLEDL
jgi:hypothetical protein